jgi:reactive chlorine resistance protein C
VSEVTEQEIRIAEVGRLLEAIGGTVLRYGLVGILLYFGALKFTEVEAKAIEPLMANSPLFSWLYGVLSVQGASNLIGAVELVIAVLIVARPLFPRLSAAGSLLAVGMFVSTLSFLATTPGIWASVPSFPLPVMNEASGFLAKDLFLLGAALWSAGEALRAVRTRAT